MMSLAAAGAGHSANTHVGEISVKPSLTAEPIAYPMFRCGSKAGVFRLQIHSAGLRLVEQDGHAQGARAPFLEPLQQKILRHAGVHHGVNQQDITAA